MICTKCGSIVPDNAKFCADCGEPVAPVVPEEPILDSVPQPEYEAPVYTAPAYVPNPVNAAAEAAASSVQTWGILGFVFSFFINLLGIIFSAIALSKASNCSRDYGFLPQKAKTGKGFGIAGLIIGILGMVISIIVVIALVAAVTYGVAESGTFTVDGF